MKRVLITGGTGFLGKRLGLALKKKFEVYLGGRNHKQALQAQETVGCNVISMDVANINSVRDVFYELKPQIVIHAAATKFVDWAEEHPMECIDVNVVGSQNVARLSIECGVDYVVGISTDKAAPPIRNTYGMSKALMERLFCAINGKSKTKFLAVRYGNVAWSTGSVLPIWKKMCKETGVIKTTGPEMRRFFFTVDEAVRLVITAMENIDDFQGKVLSRKMKAAQVEEILKVWTKHSGGRYEKIVGRPGERNDEYLIGDLELPFTRRLTINNTEHYLISFNEKAKNPLSVGLSSANTDKLTEEEILNIINNPPEEEL